ncbi:unnamed protein product [Lymnaea stagnalis]|uniref:Cytochrome P450 n=1 Tax=Lymnaea stagnalis TaxID=6523 RepID=A0AAV2I295_LYMST
MSLLTIGLALLVLVAFFYLLRSRASRNRAKCKLIPGPSGFGCIKAFISGARKNNLHVLASTWAEKYGNVVRVRLFTQDIVYINDVRMVRHLFNSPALKELTNDRPPTFISKYVVYGDKSVAFTSRTAQQRVRRKLFHSVLKFYGENVARFEEIFMKSLNKLTGQMQLLNAVDLSQEISTATLRVVDSLLAGEGSDNSGEKLATLAKFDAAFSDLFFFDNETVLQPFPFLRFVPGLSFKSKYDDLIRARDNLVDAYFYDVKKTYVRGRERGVVDQLLTAQATYEDGGNKDMLEDDVIKALLCETTIASFLTTSHAMNTLFLLVILHKEIQEKLYAEVKQVIGHDPPSLKHRGSMPYTEAAILEVLRYATAGPFLLPHYCRDNVPLGEFTIQKGAILLANVWYCHRREDQWEEPWTFKPDRFLDENGALVQADHPLRQNLLVFGIGSRSCPGEAFARSRMFLIVVTLVKNFEFFALDGVPLPDPDPRSWKPNAVMGPGPYRCGIRPRSRSV